MKYLKITLKPLDAYFLGGERNASYPDNQIQRSEPKPYFIRSNTLPSQSALFGILRYLGIRNPESSFQPNLETDGKNIGLKSFDLLSTEIQSFGKINRISPLLLQSMEKCKDELVEKHFIPAPRNRVAVDLKKDPAPVIKPFTEFIKVNTTGGVRYLPKEYKEKDAWDNVDVLCLEDGTLRGDLFQRQIRVGINRQFKKSQNKADPSGFFKKEYVVLDSAYSFLFYAEVEDHFWYPNERVVYVGQGRAPFAATVTNLEEKPAIALPEAFHQEHAEINGQPAAAPCSAVALSDIYYPGPLEELKQRCSLMIAEGKDYRVFTTNYSAAGTYGRYKKHPSALRLIPAGSVFLFFGTETQSAREQMDTFRTTLNNQEVTKTAQIAGFNHLFYSDGTSTYNKEVQQ